MEEIKMLKDRLTSLVQCELNKDLSKVDAEELGEVVDMIKDLSQTMYYCSVTEAMEKSSKEEKDHYMSMYAPETNSSRYYTPMYMRDMDRGNGRMYYTEPWREPISYNGYGNNRNTNYSPTRDYKEGRSHLTRKTYIELKENDPDPAHQAKELEKYIMELGEDITEMIEDSTPEDRATIKQKLVMLANKI